MKNKKCGKSMAAKEGKTVTSACTRGTMQAYIAFVENRTKSERARAQEKGKGRDITVPQKLNKAKKKKRTGVRVACLYSDDGTQEKTPEGEEEEESVGDGAKQRYAQTE
jgi:hypothetical protein